MKIQEQDYYYGPVLNQIAEYPVLTTINKITEKRGLYLINRSTRLLIKYSTEGGSTWSFTFTADDLAQGEGYEFVVALNCGNNSICMLRDDQLGRILDTSCAKTQTIRVWFNAGESMRVAGPSGQLDGTIRHNEFPGNLLGIVTAPQEKYAWPELGQLTVYREPPQVALRTCDRRADLVDSVGHLCDDGETTLYIGVRSYSHKWDCWSNENLKYIEDQIKYDFSFDGYKVKVERQIKPTIYPNSKMRKDCTTEFVWRVTVRP
jgi:hypothetical protein